MVAVVRAISTVLLRNISPVTAPWERIFRFLFIYRYRACADVGGFPKPKYCRSMHSKHPTPKRAPKANRISQDDAPFLIKNVRAISGFTQKQLGDSLHLSQGDVSKVSTGLVGIAKNASLAHFDDFLRQHKSGFFLSGVDVTAQRLLCNRYGDDRMSRTGGTAGFSERFRQNAERTLRVQAGKRPDNHRLVIRVRAAELPAELESLVFRDDMLGCPVFVVLVNAEMGIAEQYAVAWDRIPLLFHYLTDSAQYVPIVFRINRKQKRALATQRFRNDLNLPGLTQLRQTARPSPGKLLFAENLRAMLSDIICGVPFYRQQLADDLGVSLASLENWTVGSSCSTVPRAPTLARIVELYNRAKPILRMRLVFPHRMKPVLPAEIPNAIEILRNSIESLEKGFPSLPTGIVLDLHVEAARLNSGVQAHCFTDANGRFDSFVVLVDQSMSTSCQYSEALQELIVHSLPKFEQKQTVRV